MRLSLGECFHEINVILKRAKIKDKIQENERKICEDNKNSLYLYFVGNTSEKQEKKNEKTYT